MAVTVTHDFVTLYNGNAGIGGASTYSGFQRFGTACNGGQVSQTTTHWTTSVTSFSLVGKRISTWMTGPASVAGQASGGYRIVIGDGTSTRAYYVGGGDVSAFMQNGWNCFVLDGDALPASYAQLLGSAQPNLSAITLVGIGFNVMTKAVGNSPNVFWDIMQVGTGITVAGGTVGDPGTFDDIVVWDEQTTTATGTIRKLADGVYSAQFGFMFGATGAASHFEDTDALLYFEGGPSGSDVIRIRTQGSSGHANILRLGERLGSGESSIGVAGVTIQGTGSWSANFAGANTTVELFGCMIRGAGQGVSLGGEVRSCVIDGCDQVLPGSALVRETTFSGYTGTDGAILWSASADMERCAFNGNNRGIEHDTAGTYTYVGLTFSGNTHDIHNSSTGAVTVNATSGTNVGTFTNTNGGTTTIDNPVLVTISANVSLVGAEVRIYDMDDNPPASLGTELSGVENHNAAMYQYAGAASNLIWIQIMQDGYEEFGQPYTIPLADTSFIATLVLDTNS